MLNIESKATENELVIYLEGRLDTNTAPDLEKFLEENCLGSNVNLVLDFSKLEYLSSAGLRVLLMLSKNTNIDMYLVNVDDIIYEVFEVTGFNDILVIK